MAFRVLALGGIGAFMKHTPSNKTHTRQQTEIQSYGTVANRPISLDHKVRLTSAGQLNQIGGHAAR